MPEPKTLRDVAALGTEPNTLHSSALVMIDCQNTYREGVMQLVGVEEALDEAQRLLMRARAAQIPIFHVMHDAGLGSPYDVRAPIGQINDRVSPRADEPVIVKQYPNAFVGTELATLLGNCGTKNLLLAGFMTHMCVNSTARGAFNLGYRPTVIGSATATRDLPGPGRSVVPAAVMQAASLAALADLFAVVVDKTDNIPA